MGFDVVKAFGTVDPELVARKYLIHSSDKSWHRVVRIARCSSTRRDTCDLYRQELHRSNWVKNCGNLPAAVIIILTAGLPSTMASRLTAILRNSRFGIKLYERVGMEGQCSMTPSSPDKSSTPSVTYQH
ncbi:hypothetical protein J6590_048844 [Homalodisca vitripennis]|nr:hypothetical protein J6590_048844 [Homalodisca vitripennis]